MPTPPPIRQSTTASTRNCRKMLAARAPTAIRRPISRVRSVTETSMMFMMPTPPTTSEIRATHNSRLPINFDVVDKVLVISVMSRMLKSSVCVCLMRCRSRSNCVICADCLRDFLGRGGFGQDLVHVDEADRLRSVCRLACGRNGIRPGRAWIEIAQRVDSRRCRRVGCGRRGVL